MAFLEAAGAVINKDADAAAAPDETSADSEEN